jgi:hypothetical protein
VVPPLQGREADVVIFSCVRASGEAAAAADKSRQLGGSVGFLADVRRMVRHDRFLNWGNGIPQTCSPCVGGAGSTIFTNDSVSYPQIHLKKVFPPHFGTSLNPENPQTPR